MAEFGSAGAGLRDEDPPAPNYGKKLLKALGAAGALKGGKHKEKLRREKQRRRDAEARAEAERRTTMAARRAELHQRAVAEAAERRRQADSKSRAEARARVARATDALEAERAAARARAQREAETERRCQATERALDGAQRIEQALREQLRTKEWDLAEAERERARWHADSEQARSTAEAQRSRAQFYVAEAQRRDASGDNGNHRARFLETELERMKRERDLERERASRQAQLTETQLRFAEAELGRTRVTQQNEHVARAAAAASAQESAADAPVDPVVTVAAAAEEFYKTSAAAAAAEEFYKTSEAETSGAHFWQEVRKGQLRRPRARQWASPSWASAPCQWKCDECCVWNDKEATACVSCETPRPGAAPPPSEPSYGLHTFSVGASSAPKRGKRGRRILKAKRPPRAGGLTLHTTTEQARSTAEAQRSSAEETQRLQLQVEAWRNLMAAKKEMDQAASVLRNWPRGHCATDATHKRLHDASDNWAAARAAAEASTQEGDGDPDIYARLQSQHEQHNLHRRR